MSSLIGHRHLLMGVAGAPPLSTALTGQQATTGYGSLISINSDAAQIFNNLVAWWKLDDNAANSTVLDSHGSNNLTLSTNVAFQNTSTWSTTTAVIGGRAMGYAQTANLTAYAPLSNTVLRPPTTTSFSVGAWVRTTSASAKNIIGRFGSPATFQQFGIRLGGGTSRSPSFSVHTTSAVEVALSAQQIPDDEWALVVGTFDTIFGFIEVRVQSISIPLTNTVAAWSGNPVLDDANIARVNWTIGSGLIDDTTFQPVGPAPAIVDEAFYMTGICDDGTFAYLYNGGAGRSYAQVMADSGN